MLRKAGGAVGREDRALSPRADALSWLGSVTSSGAAAGEAGLFLQFTGGAARGQPPSEPALLLPLPRKAAGSCRAIT